MKCIHHQCLALNAEASNPNEECQQERLILEECEGYSVYTGTQVEHRRH